MDCCRCDKRENRRLRLSDETVDALPDAIRAGIDEFVADSISTAADTVGYDGEDLADFTCAGLEVLIRVAAAKYCALATSTSWTPAMAADELTRIVRAEAA